MAAFKRLLSLCLILFCANAWAQEYGQVRAVFLGDVMLARGVETVIDEQGGDYTFPFEHIRDTLEGADLAFANLESIITSNPSGNGWWSWLMCCTFGAQPQAAPALAEVGFDVLSVANNHALDQGRDGLREGLQLLRDAGVAPVGAGENLNDAREPVFIERNGLTIAVLAYTNRGSWYNDAAWAWRSGVAWLAEENMAEDVRRAVALADVVVVSMHFGQEYQTRPNDRQRRLAQRAIDEGARLVVGHHPHVVQPLEAYGNGYIAYSLGNAVFDQSREATRTGAMLEVVFQGRDIVDIRQRSLRANDRHQPVPQP